MILDCPSDRTISDVPASRDSDENAVYDRKKLKRILITGANSYIGTSVETYLNQWPDRYSVDTLDMLDPNWREYDFTGYDSVYHVAGIAHADTGYVSEETKQQYFEVNTALTIETARIAKAAGVPQFIFMSSAIVYGDAAPIGQMKMITKDTPTSPTNFYGNSKIQAEKGLLELAGQTFKVVILRPPMIYGKGSKGNYPKLSGMARKMPVFPKVYNQRSMLYIGNLTEFVRLMIENEESGIFRPQNGEYSNTSELVQMIAKAHGRKVRLAGGCQWLLKLLSKCTGLVNKAFGSLTYDMEMSNYKDDYRRYTLEESIEETEK